MIAREWVLKRNCSMSPRQLMLAYLVVCTGSLLVAAFFAVSGVWYVLGFSLMELLALGMAFVLYGRHASDRERITLLDGCLLIEQVQIEHVRQYRLDPRYTRVEPPGTSSRLVRLEANGIKVEIGQFLTEWKRREFARELQSALASER